MVERLGTIWPIVTISLVILGCSSAAPTDSNGAVSETQSLTYDGLERTYRLSVPSTYDETRPMPLVIALHGGGGTGDKMVDLTVDLNGLADEEGFIVVYPDGVEKHWNDGRTMQTWRASAEDIDDVGFIAVMIEHLSESYAIDPGRIYALGISNGGMMSYRLACELPETFAAVAAVTASMSEELAASCAPSQSISVLVMNGDKDPLVPWDGGTIRFGRREFGEVISTADTMAFWAAENDCSPAPTITREVDVDPQDGTRVRREVYGQCRDGTGVALYAIEGGGHTWPGGLQYLPERVIGKTSQDINANETIWRFFEEHS
jgi:polyhydroxybutyrate depolymerase